MRPIMTRCPVCDDNVPVDVTSIAIFRAATPVFTVHYGFVCPVCGEPVLRSVTHATADVLTALGASATGPVGGNALSDPDAAPEGSPFTFDDLIAFHMLLRDDTWLQREISRASFRRR